MLKKGKITVDVDENQMSWNSARPNSRQQPPTLQWAELSPPPHTHGPGRLVLKGQWKAFFRIMFTIDKARKFILGYYSNFAHLYSCTHQKRKMPVFATWVGTTFAITFFVGYYLSILLFFKISN